MDNVLEIKLPITLPKLEPEDLDAIMAAMEDVYRRAYADAKENLCAGCGYKSYYSQVAAQGDCNDCGKARSCQYVPRPGGITRINCPLWRAKGQGGRGMGFKKTVIYGGKCDRCGKDRLYRIENAEYYDNPSRTRTAESFKRDGWKIKGKSWCCPECAAEKERR